MALFKKKSLLDKAVGKANDYVDVVRPGVGSAVDVTRDFYESTAKPAILDAVDKAGPALADARDKAVEKAGPYVSEARDRTVAALAEARDNAGPVLSDARDKAVEKAAPLVSEARGRAGDAAAQAKEAADARVAQLRGEQPKGSRLKKVLLIAAVAGAVGFVAKKLQGGGSDDNWQSSYVPAPAPSTPAADAAGSTPDEAVSDDLDQTPPASTPDEPAAVIDVEPPNQS